MSAAIWLFVIGALAACAFGCWVRRRIYVCSDCNNTTAIAGHYERGWRIMWLTEWERPRDLCRDCADVALAQHGVSR